MARAHRLPTPDEMTDGWVLRNLGKAMMIVSQQPYTEDLNNTIWRWVDLAVLTTGRWEMFERDFSSDNNGDGLFTTSWYVQPDVDDNDPTRMYMEVSTNEEMWPSFQVEVKVLLRDSDNEDGEHEIVMDETVPVTAITRLDTDGPALARRKEWNERVR